jgi:hypothetical protein
MRLLLSLISCFVTLSCATGGRYVEKPKLEIFILGPNGVADSGSRVLSGDALSNWGCMSPTDWGSLLVYMRSLREAR